MPVHESTLALSVYNVLMRAGTMTEQQILGYLRTHWAPEVLDAEVKMGIDYLKSRSLVHIHGDAIGAANVRNGVAHPLMRRADTPTELVLA